MMKTQTPTIIPAPVENSFRSPYRVSAQEVNHSCVKRRVEEGWERGGGGGEKRGEGGGEKWHDP